MIKRFLKLEEFQFEPVCIYDVILRAEVNLECEEHSYLSKIEIKDMLCLRSFLYLSHISFGALHAWSHR